MYLYLGNLANRAACPFGRPRRLGHGAPHQSRRRSALARSPRSTARQTRPVPLSRTEPRPATLRRVFLKRGRRPAIVVASHVRARVTSGARPVLQCIGLVATIALFFHEKARETHVRHSRDSQTQRPVGRARRATVVPVAIGGPIGHQFRSAHGLSAPRWRPEAEGTGASRVLHVRACRSCDSGERQVRPKYQIPVLWWLLFLRFLFF